MAAPSVGLGLGLSGAAPPRPVGPTPMGFEPTPKKKKDSCWARQHRVWISTTVGLSFFVLGMVASSLGIILVNPPRAADEEFPSDWFGLSFVFFAQSLGHILGSIMASLALDKFSFSTLRANCFFLASVASGLATFPSIDALWKLILVVVFIGIGVGWIETTGNKLLMGLYAEKVEIFMQSIHIAFGIGAAGAPWLILILTVKIAILTMSGLVFAVSLLNLIIAFGDLPEESNGILLLNAVGVKHYPRLEINKRPWQHSFVVLICALVLFIFAATHQMLSAWTYRYAVAFEFPDSDRAILVSVYWGAFTFTRLLMKLIHYITPTLYGLICLFGCIAAAMILCIPYFHSNPNVTLWSHSISIGVIGLCLSGVFAAVLAIPTEFFVWIRGRDSWFFSLTNYLGILAGPLGVSLAWNWHHQAHLILGWVLLFSFTTGFLLLVGLYLFVSFSSTMKHHIVSMNKPSSSRR